MRAPATRREFLKATATAALAATASARVEAKDAAGHSGGIHAQTPDHGTPRLRGASAASRAAWRGSKKETIILAKPHVVTPDSPYLNSSGEIANKRFLLDPARLGPAGFPTGTLGRQFKGHSPLSAFGLLTLPPGSKNIRIVDCAFEGPWRSIEEIPDLRPGVPKHLRGIDMYDASRIRIEGCSFDHLPAEAINFHGCVDVAIEDAWSTSCTQLVRAQWMGRRRNRHIRLNRLHHADGWGAADLTKYPDYASIYETGRAIGSNAVSGFFADSEISNLTTSGEVKSALKLVNPVRVKLDRIYTSHFMIQGTFYWNMSRDPSKGNGKLGAYNHPGFDQTLGDHAVDVLVTRSRFRPHQNAWVHGDERNTVQLSYHQEKIRFKDCVFYRPDQSKYKHQGIQAWDGVDLDVRRCLFVGWKQPADPLPPFPKQTIVRMGTYRAPGSLPASLNADFVHVNRFQP